MNNKLSWLERTGDRLGNWADALADALGAYLVGMLRLTWYGLLGLMAGVAIGDPFRTAGIVLGVAVMAELSIAAFVAFVDVKSIMVGLYILVWWPLRYRVGFQSPVGKLELPNDRTEARLVLLETVR